MVVTLTPAELATLAASDVDLVDVRDRAEYEGGHIDGARLVPLAVLRADPDAVLAHGRTIVFVCAKGVRSMEAAKLAERFGYQQVYNLAGGTKEWARSGGKLVCDARAAA